MKEDDLWTITPVTQYESEVRTLREDLVEALKSGAIAGDDDLDTAIALTELVRSELLIEARGDEPHLNDSQTRAAQLALRHTVERHGITLNLPWRDMSGFRERRGPEGRWHSYEDKVALVDTYFEPVREQLFQLEEKRCRAVLADPVSPRADTGWHEVDDELAGMKRRFRSATTDKDYRDVGLRAVATLEALSRTVFRPADHLQPNETEPPVANTKLRIGRYVDVKLAGKGNDEVRAVATKVIELAQRVKHTNVPTRRDAGICADSVILLANILRRIDDA